jgi:hypothetical protein
MMNMKSSIIMVNLKLEKKEIILNILEKQN